MTGNPQVGRIWRMDPAPSGPDDPRMRGFSLEGRPYAPDDWPLRRVLRTGEEVSGEIIRIVRGDGTDGYLNVNAGPVRDRDGTLVAVVLAFEDITAFVQAERTLHETYSQLTHLYEAAPVGLAFLSPDMRFERVNQALAEMTGTTIEEQTGRTLREVLPDLADTLEPVAVLREGRAILRSSTPPHPSRPGELHHLRSYYPVRADDGHVAGHRRAGDGRDGAQDRGDAAERGQYRTLTNTVPARLVVRCLRPRHLLQQPLVRIHRPLPGALPQARLAGGRTLTTRCVA
jgi:PAS domain-containing protein